jgi:hypothetical protein
MASAEYQRAWRAKNKAIVSARNKAARDKEKARPDYLERCKARNFKHYWSNPEKRRAWATANYRKNRNWYLEKQHGLAKGDYNRILERQGGVCALCDQTSDVALQIDHDHATGQVRGLLCHKCNKALGLVNDNHVVLARAVAYVWPNPDRVPGEPYYEGAF